MGYISKQEWHACIKDECILLLYLKGLNIARREHFLSYQSCARSLSARHRSRLTLYCIDQDGRLIEWLIVHMNFVYPRRSSIAILRTSVESHPASKQKERTSYLIWYSYWAYTYLASNREERMSYLIWYSYWAYTYHNQDLLLYSPFLIFYQR
jgi:hypothetical protein